MNGAANTFRADLKPRFGMATIAPQRGTFFDANGDLFLDTNGVIHPRHSWQGRDIDATQHRSVTAACADALISYNRATMSHSDFADHYADDPSECGMLFA